MQILLMILGLQFFLFIRYTRSFALLWLSKVDGKALISLALTYMWGVPSHMAQNVNVKKLVAMFVFILAIIYS